MSETIILIRRSGISGSVPASGSLQIGELALNTTDGGLFYHDTGSDSVELIRAGTASFALNAASGGAGGPSSSWSETSSYTETWDGGHYETGSTFVSVQPSPLSASWALTASFAENGAGGGGGAFGGNFSGSFTGSMTGTFTGSALIESGTLTFQTEDLFWPITVRSESGQLVFAGPSGDWMKIQSDSVAPIINDGSQISGVISASFATTSSFAANANGVTRDAPAQSDMLVWLKADAGVNLDTTVSPALVEIWEDQSGNGNDASASNGSTSRPEFVSESGAFNDYEYIHFDGTNDMLRVDLGAPFTGISCSAWVVARRKATSPANYGICSFYNTGSADWTSNSFFAMEAGSSGNKLETFWDSNKSTVTTDNLTSGSYIWNTEFDGGFNRARKDGETFAETAKTTAFGFTFLSIAARELGSGPASFGNQDFVEIVLYNRNLTDNEITDMEAYLSNKYSIPIRGVAGK